MMDAITFVFQLLSVFGCSAIVSGLMLFYIKRYYAKKDRIDLERQAKEEEKQQARRDELDERDKLRTEKDRLQLDLMMATAKLTHANSIAIQNGKCNGAMHEAMDDYKAVYGDLDAFCRKQTVYSLRTCARQ